LCCGFDTILNDAHAIAHRQCALATHGDMRRHDAIALFAAVEHAAARTHHRHHDRGIGVIIILSRRQLGDHFADEHSPPPRMSMLIEQRLPVVFGDRRVRLDAFVAHKGAAQTPGRASRFSVAHHVVE